MVSAFSNYEGSDEMDGYLHAFDYLKNSTGVRYAVRTYLDLLLTEVKGPDMVWKCVYVCVYNVYVHFVGMPKRVLCVVAALVRPAGSSFMTSFAPVGGAWSLHSSTTQVGGTSYSPVPM